MQFSNQLFHDSNILLCLQELLLNRHMKTLFFTESLLFCSLFVPPLISMLLTQNPTWTFFATDLICLFRHQRRLEIGFTMFYDAELVFKIFCLGFKGFISPAIHKFELLLAIGTTIHILPGMATESMFGGFFKYLVVCLFLFFSCGMEIGERTLQ